ncbi:uncharacterized protein F5891DRAFT_1193820 [Suillus fuscotomentosus]|uniref:Uncharacterized protein n=1 Tax=Suillus fuscotomentosus TaxID=1912939 RepID=A0AAD4DX71_9AGAM|nr:uncharacterized protein F5891DRAFT_1193820 [Suillus fuscotomentosus]KAG1895808.1 hypothetical protein F5891DRAFT_1193820 [Suillus fuscotomentosus]
MPPRILASPKKKWAKRKDVLATPMQEQEGSTSLDSTVPVHPWAPEPPRGKGRGCHPKVAPPPYTSSATTNVPNTSHADVSTVEPLQPLNPLF